MLLGVAVTLSGDVMV